MRYKRDHEGFEQHLAYTVKNCGKKWLVLSNKESITAEYLLTPSTCKSNYCPNCRKQNLRILRHKLLRGMKSHRWRLITLTYEQAGKTPLEILRMIRATFNRFSKRLRRAYPKVIFIRTIEVHQSGYPHIHLVVDTFVPIAWLQKNWHECGGGITDIRSGKTVDGKKKKLSYKDAACYLTEEIEKERQDPHSLGVTFWQAGIRSVATSRNFKLLNGSTPWEFMVMKPNLEEAYTVYQQLLYEHRVYDRPKPGVSQVGDAIYIGPGRSST